MKSKKSTAKPDSELAKWCELLAQSTATAETVPPGWFTTKELAKKFGGTSTVKTKVLAHAKAGRVQTRVFRIRLNKMVRPVRHYRLP